MSTLFERGMSMIGRLAPAAAGGVVTYRRGDDAVEIPGCVFGKTEFQAYKAQEVVIEHTDRDFIFCWRMLVLGGQVATPARGDRITTDDESVYEVLPVDGEKCYRTSGPDSSGRDVLIRVHGKKLA